MNSIIALIVKLSGGGFIWQKIDGYKTILGFVGKMLAGAGSMLIGASAIVATVVACKDMACIVGVVRGFSTNADGIMLIAGFYAFCSGLQGLGIWHKEQKATSGQAIGYVAPSSSDTIDGADVIK